MITDKLFEHKEEVGTLLVATFGAMWKLIKKKPKDNCDSCGLCRHKLFQIMDSFLLNIENPNWKCINAYKTSVAKDMIRDKFNVGKVRIRDWVCKNRHIQDSSTLCDSFNDMIVAMINEYEEKWIVRGISSIIINKLSKYHNNNARYAVKVGKNELRRDYNSTQDSLHHLLDSLIVPYSMFISDIRNVMDSFNGQLKDDVYNGIKNTGEYKEFEMSKLEFSFEEE